MFLRDCLCVQSLKPDDVLRDMKGVVAGNQKVGLDHLLMTQWQQQPNSSSDEEDGRRL